MTAPNNIKLELWLGSMIATPASAAIMERLDSVEVTCADNAPRSFRLTFKMDRAATPSADFALLSGGDLAPWNRVVVSVGLGSGSQILIDGFITQHELSHDGPFAGTVLNVIGEDVSILMDRVQFSLEYPQMGDSLIALTVLAKYGLIGVVPEVLPTAADLTPLVLERIPQQNATDRAYLRELAAPHGYMFHVRPGPEPMTNIAYWGPPLNVGSVKPALSVDLGPSTNVDRISFRLDSLAPIQLYGMVQDNETEIDAPLVTLGSSRMPPLSTDPALNPIGLLQRRDLFTDPRLGYFQALASAQATTDVSTDQAVTAQGEVDTLRYGAVLEAPGLVDVRGAGTSYDGRYRVKTVTHSLARGRYQQSFTLAREGTGSTIDRVAA
ncbi:MAG: hypothetical protein E7773_07935 [Sphingomonas sp.]|uniref:phage late control D family protein n=1 Tax=Sphingomonas sp. TaxID=28214 RepID=UPI00121BE467|nr:hypothetical protein [Sphingomonas sp.]THD35870.1 MAG: hypothetical protein E7773_07935 [Sphingomonas sp.]